MKIRRHPLVENHGHVLLASLMLVIMLSLLSMTALYLVGQDAPGISAMREYGQTQQLADAATELVVSWFHDASTTPASIAERSSTRLDPNWLISGILTHDLFAALLVCICISVSDVRLTPRSREALRPAVRDRRHGTDSLRAPREEHSPTGRGFHPDSEPLSRSA